jgi:sugar phosphate isomerase/epimerase
MARPVTLFTGSWDFRSIGHGDINFEDIVVALNDIGYQGPLSIEWEDIRIDRVHGATVTCQDVSPRVGSPLISRLSGINSNSQEVSFLCNV